ncbi:MAG: hypothetical protein R3F21_09290 [Myxococcota bacterium]
MRLDTNSWTPSSVPSQERSSFREQTLEIRERLRQSLARMPGDEYRITSNGTGYRWVVVNGRITIEDHQPTNVHSGVLLRHGR